MSEHRHAKLMRIAADDDKARFTHGLIRVEHPISIVLAYPDNDWKLVEKPKPKQKRWLWATADGRDSTFGFHASGEDACNDEGFLDGKKWTVKLKWSETEFEE